MGGLGVGFQSIIEPVPHAITRMKFQFFFGHGFKFFVVGAKHDYINVIVPRNETLMSNRAQKRAADCVPANVVFFADARNFFEQPDFHVPQFFSVTGDKKTAAHLVAVDVVDKNFASVSFFKRQSFSQKFISLTQQFVLFPQKFVLFGQLPGTNFFFLHRTTSIFTFCESLSYR